MPVSEDLKSHLIKIHPKGNYKSISNVVDDAIFKINDEKQKENNFIHVSTAYEAAKNLYKLLRFVKTKGYKKIYVAKKNNEDSIEMWGKGNAKREFMYIKDLVDFIFILLKKKTVASRFWGGGLFFYHIYICVCVCVCTCGYRSTVNPRTWTYTNI